MKSINSKIRGDHGERLALEYLQGKGFKLVAKNWRSGRAEVDIIMEDGEYLVFIEVKMRNTEYYGTPLDAVSDKKLSLLQQAAVDYMDVIVFPQPIRIDVIGIVNSDSQIKIEHFEDVL